MIRFDDAISAVLTLLREKFGGAVGDAQTEFPAAHVVRDVAGTIVVVLADNALEDDEWDAFATQLHRVLGPYSAGQKRVLLRESDLIDPLDVLDSPDRISLDLPNSWLIDRLLNNQDWIRAPIRESTLIPTAVAYSVKGGVGRSTAFSMLAWYLARIGKKVIVVDLDLEAPGIGELLLKDAPDYGLIDWLVENISGQADADFLNLIIAESPLSNETDGWIRVIPAYGRSSGNYISKLGRVYASSFDSNGKVLGLAEHLNLLLQKIEKLDDAPDVILLDSRAGLHDIGSAAVTRLGAEVFMFARNDDQDWWSYGKIFDHLRSSTSVSKGMGDDADLRWKLKMVAAQTIPNDSVRRGWIDRSYSEWTKFYDDESAVTIGADFEPVVFSRDDEEAPHHPLFINFELGVKSLSLKDVYSLPTWEYIQGIFGEFFAGAQQRLWPQEQKEIKE